MPLSELFKVIKIPRGVKTPRWASKKAKTEQEQQSGTTSPIRFEIHIENSSENTSDNDQARYLFFVSCSLERKLSNV